MAKHSSATAHSETPHVLELSRTNTVMNALKQRALAVLNDESLDAQSRAVSADGSVRKLNGTERDREHGEALCLHSLRRVESLRNGRHSGSQP